MILLQEANTLVQNFLSRAQCVIDTQDKLEIYSNALRICNKHKFNTTAAEIHCKMAEVYLGRAQYGSAKTAAEQCVQCDPDNPQVL